MRIDAKAPTRVDLAGGTLDIWPLYLFHPGAVTINAAISRYAYCVIDSNAPGDDRIKLVSLDTNCSESFASFEKLVHGRHYKLPLLAEIVKFFKPKGGFSLTTNSEAPAGAGIGGSSAMAVAICAAWTVTPARAGARSTGSISAATPRLSSLIFPPACRTTTHPHSVGRQRSN